MSFVIINFSRNFLGDDLYAKLNRYHKNINSECKIRFPRSKSNDNYYTYTRCDVFNFMATKYFELIDSTNYKYDDGNCSSNLYRVFNDVHLVLERSYNKYTCDTHKIVKFLKII